MVVVSVVFCTTFYRHVHTFEIDLTIEIRAGVKECFWQHIKRESSAELEYQVRLFYSLKMKLSHYVENIVLIKI